MLPRLLADENIAREIVRGLRALGYEVSYIAEHSASIPDPVVLALSRTEQRWLVTHDRDYGELIFKKGHPAPPGVVYLRLVSEDFGEQVVRVVAAINKADARAGFVTVGRRGGSAFAHFLPMPALEPVPISALQHWSYCPRQCALIHVEQVFADNVHTARGHAVHKLVDEPGAERSGTVRIERAMPLWSEALGLIGKADLVEFDAQGTPYPVEYKHGPRRKSAHDELQLAAQALCLEEMTGRPVMLGALFQFSSKRRREVAIDDLLRGRVVETIKAVRNQIESGRLPPPLVNDARCRACSLIELCQPAALGARARYRNLLSELLSTP